MTITLDRPFAATDKGKRKNNEDCIYPVSELASAGQKIFLVCDGVGGASKGEVASSLACECLNTFFDTFLEHDNPTEEFVNKAVRYAEARFDEYISQNPAAQGMATTLTMLYNGANGITIAHIGDSRIYHFRKGLIINKTEDHSLVNSWVRLGIIKPEEAAHHPQRNVITRAITGTAMPVEADVKLITDIRPGDRFLMCTDGVTEQFSDNDLCLLFATARNAENIKDTIVERCINEAKDNFSFYILPVQKTHKKN
ncbi:MAG: protein phosphatase 2C domain-containing protein [Tannerella sp.]|jgi:protein phosphatase|nr:protein phosphatase 2C domain-containing protein [Tannerella sp.]